MRRSLIATLGAFALVATLVFFVRASGDEERCAQLAERSAARAAADIGSGPRVAVIGDSYAFGTGLDRVERSWPSQLPGRVHVDGFPGSGFSARASACPRVAYADRAAAASRGADLVVVQGGLNDVDRRGAAVRAGFARLIRAVAGHDVVVVGPAAAPARRKGVPRIDRLLSGLAADAGVRYLRTSHLKLSYLDDRLHLTAGGHDEFGSYVARTVARRLR